MSTYISKLLDQGQNWPFNPDFERAVNYIEDIYRNYLGIDYQGKLAKRLLKDSKTFDHITGFIGPLCYELGDAIYQRNVFAADVLNVAIGMIRPDIANYHNQGFGLARYVSDVEQNYQYSAYEEGFLKNFHEQFYKKTALSDYAGEMYSGILMTLSRENVIGARLNQLGSGVNSKTDSERLTQWGIVATTAITLISMLPIAVPLKVAGAVAAGAVTYFAAELGYIERRSSQLQDDATRRHNQIVREAEQARRDAKSDYDKAVNQYKGAIKKREELKGIYAQCKAKVKKTESEIDELRKKMDETVDNVDATDVLDQIIKKEKKLEKQKVARDEAKKALVKASNEVDKKKSDVTKAEKALKSSIDNLKEIKIDCPVDPMDREFDNSISQHLKQMNDWVTVNGIPQPGKYINFVPQDYLNSHKFPKYYSNAMVVVKGQAYDGRLIIYINDQYSQTVNTYSEIVGLAPDQMRQLASQISPKDPRTALIISVGDIDPIRDDFNNVINDMHIKRNILNEMEYFKNDQMSEDEIARAKLIFRQYDKEFINRLSKIDEKTLERLLNNE